MCVVCVHVCLCVCLLCVCLLCVCGCVGVFVSAFMLMSVYACVSICRPGVCVLVFAVYLCVYFL